MRLQVSPRPDSADGRSQAVTHRLQATGFSIENVTVCDVYMLHPGNLLSHAHAAELFCDPVSQRIRIDTDEAPPPGNNNTLIEVTYKPGVANPVVSSICELLRAEIGERADTLTVQTATQYWIEGGDARSVEPALHNPLIEHATVLTPAAWKAGERPPALYPGVVTSEIPPVEQIPVATLSDSELTATSQSRLLALTLEEMQAIRAYYADPAVTADRKRAGLAAAATDVELELLAQTWSEHCKHKIFAARITYTDETGATETIDSLFKSYIKATTLQTGDASFVKSVFDDNAGVVQFNEEWLACIKAETHNSPSALDPYGGAITGIVGVNRDILGTGKGARPIFNTDVLCFGYPDTPEDELPEGLLHPAVVLDGVHRGIVDGGNQSGIPVAAGAVLFDESYTGKPLVFCGTGGLMPARVAGEDSWIKHVQPGDMAVMAGGRIGKDGIHGATFSSLALDESSPTSAVQIGEPITQKRMLDFLLEARDQTLFKGVTDNGAGGLSSSLGEMARESGGVEIDLDACPLKYDGLAAWEILVSESQERMSLAVDPTHWEELQELALRHDVEVSAVGRFTDSGSITVTHRGATVALLSLAFVHEGLPQLDLVAEWTGPRGAWGRGAQLQSVASPQSADLRAPLLQLMADPNIGSKEFLIRQYDHEVQGQSVIKPFCGHQSQGPTDGAVLKPLPHSNRGLSVTHGICPRYGDVDTYAMAAAAVDEAVRAHVALGGDPDQMAALDNFCWPDPVESEQTPDGRYKLAQLVRCCKGLADTCMAYGLPLVSGKDSMKNDASLGGRKVSIRPTLLVTLMGIVPDVSASMTTDFKGAGDIIALIGSSRPVLGGSALERHYPNTLGGEPAPQTDAAANLPVYRRLHAAIAEGWVRGAHDLSEGGLAVALAESALAAGMGCEISLPVESGDGTTALRELYGERTGAILVTVRREDRERLRERFGNELAVLGTVTPEPTLVIDVAQERLRWILEEIRGSWHAFAASRGAITTPRTVAPPAGALSVGAPPVGAPGQSAALAHGAGPAGSSRRPGSPTAPVVGLLVGLGINADRELAAAFEAAGARVDPLHVNALLADPSVLQRCSILAVPGGFSYGDHVGSGMMLAHRMRSIRDELDRHHERGGLTLGICNGFQVLVKMGLLPNVDGSWERTASLVHNDHGQFEDSWVTVSRDERCSSVWLEGIQQLDLPIRHGEGRFVTESPETLGRLSSSGQIALRYLGRNPNGSAGDVAGIVDPTGRVFGLMPHPEAFLSPLNHPHWRSGMPEPPSGIGFFENAVAHVRRTV